MTGPMAMLRWIQRYYDRLLCGAVVAGLLLSLVYLAVRIGTVRNLREDFRERMAGLAPKHPAPAPLDTGLYQAARRGLQFPQQLGVAAWSNALFVPETRVYCVDCRRPIEYETMGCPHCGAKQPPIEGTEKDADLDKDGMWDSWEREHGLDPHDASDANLDSDDDGFTNIEEFMADPRTDPRDRTDHPSIGMKLRVQSVQADPFNLLFMAATEMPGGDYKFQINLRGSGRTYFLKLKESVEGFVLEAFEKRTVMAEVPGIGGERPVDASVLALRRGDKLIRLRKGEKRTYTEYKATLKFLVDDSVHRVRLHDEVTLGDYTYVVTAIDKEPEDTVKLRSKRGEVLVIRKLPAGSGEGR